MGCESWPNGWWNGWSAFLSVAGPNRAFRPTDICSGVVSSLVCKRAVNKQYGVPTCVMKGHILATMVVGAPYNEE